MQRRCLEGCCRYCFECMLYRVAGLLRALIRSLMISVEHDGYSERIASSSVYVHIPFLRKSQGQIFWIEITSAVMDNILTVTQYHAQSDTTERGRDWSGCSDQTPSPFHLASQPKAQKRTLLICCVTQTQPHDRVLQTDAVRTCVSRGCQNHCRAQINPHHDCAFD